MTEQARQMIEYIVRLVRKPGVTLGENTSFGLFRADRLDGVGGSAAEARRPHTQANPGGQGTAERSGYGGENVRDCTAWGQAAEVGSGLPARDGE